MVTAPSKASLSMLIRATVLLVVTASLCGTAAAESLQDAQNRAKQLIEAGRRRDGFPPSSDTTGTILECDRRIKAAQRSMLTCAGARAHRLVTTSRDASDTLARAVVAGCIVEREALVRAAWPYCIPERPDAERAVEGFVRQSEDTALAIITEYRARPAPPIAAPPAARPETPL